MTTAAMDLEKLRVALHRMSRDNLLLLAERAIELVPRAKLRALVSDLVRLDDLAKTKGGEAPLLAEVRKFKRRAGAATATRAAEDPVNQTS